MFEHFLDILAAQQGWMPLCLCLESTCLPGFWPVALERAGTRHSAVCLWEPLQGTGPRGHPLEVRAPWKRGSLCWQGLGDLLPEGSGDKNSWFQALPQLFLPSAIRSVRSLHR